MNELKVSELIETKKLLDSLSGKIDIDSSGSFIEVGKNYFIRTVTMAHVGKVTGINSDELLLSDASWIADTGRFHDALKSGLFDEIEPFVNDVIVNRNSIIDITVFNHRLPTEQK